MPGHVPCKFGQTSLSLTVGFPARKTARKTLAATPTMIRIFNKITKTEILLDDNDPVIQFKPVDWDIENPHVIIELKNINFGHHSKTCNCCNSFMEALRNKSSDWFIEYQNKIKRLDLRNFGDNPSDNKCSWTISYYFTGTRLKLNIDKDTKETLLQEIKVNELSENYEKCAELLDKLKSFDE